MRLILEYVDRDGNVVQPTEAELEALATRYVLALLRSAYPDCKAEIKPMQEVLFSQRIRR